MNTNDFISQSKLLIDDLFENYISKSESHIDTKENPFELIGSKLGWVGDELLLPITNDGNDLINNQVDLFEKQFNIDGTEFQATLMEYFGDLLKEKFTQFF